ncbi:MAG: hypothetical protein WCO96_01260 [Actinomycetes bacterium]
MSEQPTSDAEELVKAIGVGIVALVIGYFALCGGDSEPSKSAAPSAQQQQKSRAEAAVKRRRARAASRAWNRYLTKYLTLYIAQTGNRPGEISISPVKTSDIDEDTTVYGSPTAIATGVAAFTTPLGSTEQRGYSTVMVEQAPGDWRVVQSEFEDKPIGG